MQTQKVKIAIVGSGYGVSSLLPAYRLAGLEVFGLWARTKEKAEKLQATHKIPFVTTDWKELVNHPEVTLVSIVTPPYLHKEMTLAALRAKKHVICEKPFAMNLAEAHEMRSVAKEHPNQLAWIDHELRFTKIFQNAKKSISQLGKMLSVSVTGCYRKDLTQNWSWWNSEELGGGVLGAAGSHFIDIVTWLTGNKITSVSAQLGNQVKSLKHENGTKEATGNDWYALNVRYGDIPGLFHYFCIPSVGFCTIIITFEGGYFELRLDSSKNQQPQFSVVKNERITECYMETSPPSIFINNVFSSGAIELAKSLKNILENGEIWDSQIPASFEDGVYVQSVMDAAMKSHKNNGVFINVSQ